MQKVHCVLRIKMVKTYTALRWVPTARSAPSMSSTRPDRGLLTEGCFSSSTTDTDEESARKQ